MKTIVYCSGLVACLLLASCGRQDPEPTGVIPQAQMDALKKAESMEQTLLDADQKRREEMARQGI